MDKISVLRQMLSKMFGINTYVVDSDEELCPLLQKMYGEGIVVAEKNAEKISSLFLSLKERVVFEYGEILGATVVLFKWLGKTIVLQPFAIEKWNEEKSRALFAKSRFPEEFFSVYKLYYLSLPVVDDEALVMLIRSTIETLSPELPPYRYSSRLSNKSAFSERKFHEELNNFVKIEERYEREQQFMRAIKEGDVKKAQKYWQAMDVTSESLNIPFIREKDFDVGIAIVRTLCKLAAYEGGVHPAMIESIARSYTTSYNKYYDQNEIKSTLNKMIEKFCDAVTETRANSHSPVVKLVLDYISLNLKSKITLKDIAHSCNVSEDYMSHIFKKEMGVSVQKHIAASRVDAAAALLWQTNMPVQDIGVEVGFFDNNYFTKVFKNHRGCTPSEYRKNRAKNK